MARPQGARCGLGPGPVAPDDGHVQAAPRQLARDLVAENAIPAEDDDAAHPRRGEDTARATASVQHMKATMVRGVVATRCQGTPVKPAATRLKPARPVTTPRTRAHRHSDVRGELQTVSRTARE